MIVTVTPNPAIDMTYHVASFDPGQSLRVDTGISRAGGKGLNVARVARQVGGDVCAIATTGGATGREFEADVIASDLPHWLIRVAAATRRSIAIVDAARDSTTIMNERGAALSADEWHALVSAARDRLDCPGGCLVGSGSLPPGVPDTFYAELVRVAAASAVPCVIDAVGPALVAAARAGADVVKPNRAELLETTGESDPGVGARRLIDAGARMVLVSLGEDGMLIVDAADAAQPLHARLEHALSGNPTGAGDAAVAAVAVSLAEGLRDRETLLRRATAWSAAAVTMPVAGVIDDNYRELESRLILDPWTR